MNRLLEEENTNLFLRKHKFILSMFRTIYEPLTEYICIKEKIESLENKTNDAKEITLESTETVKEICELIEKIKNVKMEEKSVIQSEKNNSLRYSFNEKKIPKNFLETSILSKKYLNNK